MKLSESLRRDCIFLDVKARDKRGALREILVHLAELNLIKPERVDPVLRNFMNREELGSTGIGEGVAVPHTLGNEQCFAMARSEVGIDWDALDSEPVKLFFLMASGAGASGETLERLAAVSRLVRNENATKRLRNAIDPESVIETLSAWERGEIPEPEDESVSEAMRRAENSLLNKFFEWLLSK